MILLSHLQYCILAYFNKAFMIHSPFGTHILGPYEQLVGQQSIPLN